MTNPFRQHFQRTVAATAARGTPTSVGGLRDDSAGSPRCSSSSAASR
ncbi:hypothetical protein [Burkholderia pseudomallei]|nr:hypothetical protein [Burkholderia pseudomallei]